MGEVSIVTAFFDINRGEWKSAQRSSETYFDYFEFWSRIQNYVIVYTDSEERAERIYQIRNKYVSKELTKVIVIDDISKMDSQLYVSIKKASTNKIQIESRIKPNNPESWNYNYNYVMMMKFWCIQNAIQNGYVSDNIAWIDFGFGHGTNNFIDPSDFNFKWEYEFGKKIYLFNIQELDDRPIFDIIKSMDTYFMGPIIFGGQEAWEEFCPLVRSKMIELNDCGLVDDDQVILLMAYRARPDLFVVNKTNWFTPIKMFANAAIKMRNSNEKDKNYSILKAVKKKIIHRHIVIKMLKREWKHFSKIDIH